MPPEGRHFWGTKCFQVGEKAKNKHWMAQKGLEDDCQEVFRSGACKILQDQLTFHLQVLGIISCSCWFYIRPENSVRNHMHPPKFLSQREN